MIQRSHALMCFATIAAIVAFGSCGRASAAATNGSATATSGDGYDSAFARQVRAATEQYRLALWAGHDGYIATTDYVDGFGKMYTNHERFDPPNLANPTALLYNQAGVLVAVGYQFTRSAALVAPFRDLPNSAWYGIDKHVHYNVQTRGALHYGQGPWNSDEQPTLAALRAHKYVSAADAKLLFAFVHPAVRAIIVWAWMANDNGLFAGDNPALP